MNEEIIGLNLDESTNETFLSICLSSKSENSDCANSFSLKDKYEIKEFFMNNDDFDLAIQISNKNYNNSDCDISINENGFDTSFY